MKPELRALSITDLSLSLCFAELQQRTRDTKGALKILSSNATGQPAFGIFVVVALTHAPFRPDAEVM
jgi:hypothetical protein